MKIIQKWLVLCTLCMGVSARAQVLTTEGGLSTVGFDPKYKLTPADRAADLGGTVANGREVKILVSEGPAEGADRDAFVVNAANLAHTAGTFPEGPRQSPTDVRLLKNVTGANFVNGNAVWLTFHEKAGTNDSIAIAGTEIVISSSDVYQDGSTMRSNILGETFTWTAANTYTTSAILWKDGQPITSGSASQRGQEIVYSVGLKRFTASLADVNAFLNLFKNWAIKATDTHDGQFIGSLTLYKAPPGLLTKVSGSNVILQALNNGDVNSYDFEYTANLNSPITWTPGGTITGGDILTLTNLPMPNAFIRYVAP